MPTNTLPSTPPNTLFESLRTYFIGMPVRNRILKEYKLLQNAELQGISLKLTDNIHLYYADIQVYDNPIYKESYRIKIMIPEEYPFVAPVVVFVKNLDEGITTIPLHPHIYSNGHICLDILGPSWSPAHTLMSLVLSIQSFIAGNSRLERPPDDSRYVRYGPKNPSKTRFSYDDDTV